ncbi:MAG TPA: class I SAM-dependent methyltransferase [Phenylobacterium sp.]|nr:class I SAM-dependent methyltransferase [Phenylobacterium sp.]
MPPFIDRFTTRLLMYLHRRFYIDHRRHRPLEIVYETAAQQSAEFILANLDEAVLFDDRTAYWNHLIEKFPKTGLLMECGVFKGESINHIADVLKKDADTRTIHGFDSFEGLEEDWAGENLTKGDFDQKGALPPVRSNVRLYKGWVQDTVAPFLAEHPGEPLALLHIDTDTYTPAKYLLEQVKPRLTSGSIIAFDELVGYPNWRAHEYKALQEVLDPGSYTFVAFTSRRAAIVMK